MVFSSILFLLYFLPPVLGVAWWLSREHQTRAANAWLLLASLVFYAWGAPGFLPVLLLVCAANHQLVLHLHLANGQRRKRLRQTAVGLNVILLVGYKYLGFITTSICKALGMGAGPDLGIALPIGISFFTFQAISYVMDVDRKNAPPVDSFEMYLVYILSFPQMIAGPIVRFTAVQAELRKRQTLFEDWHEGAYRFGVGLAKKVLIANPLAAIYPLEASAMNSSMLEWGSAEATVALLAYTFQIYFDFSGYSDMAIGLGRMLGFRFPENFRNPYLSGSITEFWRRWHITLGDWMRDHLYIPLGGNRGSLFRTHINLISVFAISGLWHGASWNFLLWGLYHGTFLLFDRWGLKQWLNRRHQTLQTGITFLVVAIGWIVFALPDFEHTSEFVARLVGKHGAGSLHLDARSSAVLTLAALLVFLPIRKHLEQKVLRSSARLVAGTLFWIVSIVELSASGFNPFIYFRF